MPVAPWLFRADTWRAEQDRDLSHWQSGERGRRHRRRLPLLLCSLASEISAACLRAGATADRATYESPRRHGHQCTARPRAFAPELSGTAVLPWMMIHTWIDSVVLSSAIEPCAHTCCLEGSQEFCIQSGARLRHNSPASPQASCWACHSRRSARMFRAPR